MKEIRDPVITDLLKNTEMSIPKGNEAISQCTQDLFRGLNIITINKKSVKTLLEKTSSASIPIKKEEKTEKEKKCREVLLQLIPPYLRQNPEKTNKIVEGIAGLLHQGALNNHLSAFLLDYASKRSICLVTMSEARDENLEIIPHYEQNCFNVIERFDSEIGIANYKKDDSLKTPFETVVFKGSCTHKITIMDNGEVVPEFIEMTLWIDGDDLEEQYIETTKKLESISDLDEKNKLESILKDIRSQYIQDIRKYMFNFLQPGCIFFKDPEVLKAILNDPKIIQETLQDPLFPDLLEQLLVMIANSGVLKSPKSGEEKDLESLVSDTFDEKEDLGVEGNIRYIFKRYFPKESEKILHFCHMHPEYIIFLPHHEDRQKMMNQLILEAITQNNAELMEKLSSIKILYADGLRLLLAEETSEKLKNIDANTFLPIVRTNVVYLKDASPEVKKNNRVIEAAIEKNPYAIAYVPREVQTPAVKQKAIDGFKALCEGKMIGVNVSSIRLSFRQMNTLKQYLDFKLSGENTSLLNEDESMSVFKGHEVDFDCDTFKKINARTKLQLKTKNKQGGLDGIKTEVIQHDGRTLVKILPCDLSGVGGDDTREKLIKQIVENALNNTPGCKTKTYQEVYVSACVGIRGRIQVLGGWFTRGKSGSHMNAYIKTPDEKKCTRWEPRRGPQAFFNDTICAWVTSAATSVFEHQVLHQSISTSLAATKQILKNPFFKKMFKQILDIKTGIKNQLNHLYQHISTLSSPVQFFREKLAALKSHPASHMWVQKSLKENIPRKKHFTQEEQNKKRDFFMTTFNELKQNITINKESVEQVMSNINQNCKIGVISPAVMVSRLIQQMLPEGLRQKNDPKAKLLTSMTDALISLLHPEALLQKLEHTIDEYLSQQHMTLNKTNITRNIAIRSLDDGLEIVETVQYKGPLYLEQDGTKMDLTKETAFKATCTYKIPIQVGQVCDPLLTSTSFTSEGDQQEKDYNEAAKEINEMTKTSPEYAAAEKKLNDIINHYVENIDKYAFNFIDPQCTLAKDPKVVKEVLSKHPGFSSFVDKKEKIPLTIPPEDSDRSDCKPG